MEKKELKEQKDGVHLLNTVNYKDIQLRSVSSGDTPSGKNGVGILIDRELKELVVEVRRVNDKMMSIKLVTGGLTVNVIKKLFIEGDFNGHIGAAAGGYDDVHVGFSFGDRNIGGTSLLDFATAFELVIANSSFQNKEEHLVNFQSSVAKTQIDYLLLTKSDDGLCINCKVIPSENLMT
uniref:Craniofacial development protein 2-like n=1 Tax=Nicotiana tabacum TaxID=4097 RepID=A0A1S3XU95_TOBAC|nr:PREDICTED: uncharacterized protein LOC107768808 [Nicotiana tabacum]